MAIGTSVARVGNCSSCVGLMPQRVASLSFACHQPTKSAAIEKAVGLPLAPYILVQTSGGTLRADSVPARLKLPVPDEGPHKSYALQWFAFAVIAVVGGVALTIRTR